MLVLGNVDDDAASHPDMALRSQLVNNINSDLMFMILKLFNLRHLILLIYTRPAMTMFSSTFDNERCSSSLTLLGWPKPPDDTA